MILSKPHLLQYVQSGRIKFDPPVPEDSIEQVSIDLRLGHRFSVLKKPAPWIGDVCVDKSIFEADLWDEKENLETFTLEPQVLVLAQTLEKVHVPADLAGMVEGRSSYARLGITIHVTAPKIDPGYNTHITLEMVNFNKVPVKVRAEIDKPAQLMFFKLSKKLKASELYGMKATDIFQSSIGPIPKKPQKS